MTCLKQSRGPLSVSLMSVFEILCRAGSWLTSVPGAESALCGSRHLSAGRGLGVGLGLAVEHSPTPQSPCPGAGLLGVISGIIKHYSATMSHSQDAESTEKSPKKDLPWKMLANSQVP